MGGSERTFTEVFHLLSTVRVFVIVILCHETINRKIAQHGANKLLCNFICSLLEMTGHHNLIK